MFSAIGTGYFPGRVFFLSLIDPTCPCSMPYAIHSKQELCYTISSSVEPAEPKKKEEGGEGLRSRRVNVMLAAKTRAVPLASRVSQLKSKATLAKCFSRQYLLKNNINPY